MDTFKLTYFNLRGVVEPIRLLFKYANVPFEDDQVEAKTWMEVKKDFKWQQLPILEYNGKTLTQSGAIGNFLAAKFKLSPEDCWEQAKCDEIVGAINDLRLRIKPLITSKLEGNLEQAEKLREQILEESIPLFLTNFNEILEELEKQSGSSSGTDLILGGSKPTMADFCLAHFTDQWTTVLKEPSLLDKYPMLKKQQNAVYSLPGVAEWIAVRPQTFI